jgi:hypothetical protein
MFTFCLSNKYTNAEDSFQIVFQERLHHKLSKFGLPRITLITTQVLLLNRTFSIKSSTIKQIILQGKDLRISDKHQATASLILNQVQ